MIDTNLANDFATGVDDSDLATIVGDEVDLFNTYRWAPGHPAAEIEAHVEWHPGGDYTVRYIEHGQIIRSIYNDIDEVRAWLTRLDDAADPEAVIAMSHAAHIATEQVLEAARQNRAHYQAAA